MGLNDSGKNLIHTFFSLLTMRDTTTRQLPPSKAGLRSAGMIPTLHHSAIGLVGTGRLENHNLDFSSTHPFDMFKKI
jgi:hypothetical protein